MLKMDLNELYMDLLEKVERNAARENEERRKRAAEAEAREKKAQEAWQGLLNRAGEQAAKENHAAREKELQEAREKAEAETRAKQGRPSVKTEAAWRQMIVNILGN